MELSDYLRVLRKRWLIVVGVLIVTVTLTAGALALMTPTYTSSTRLFFVAQGGETLSELSQGSTFTSNQMASYAEVARSPLTLQPVIEELGLDVDAAELASQITTHIIDGTNILTISAESPEPEAARDIANAVGAQLTASISELSPQRADGAEPVRVTVLDKAEVSAAASSPNVPRSLALAVALGVFLGVGVALVREMTDTRVRAASDIEHVTDRPVLVSIPRANESKKGALPQVYMHANGHGPRAEAMRKLRANLQFLAPAGTTGSVLVTSADAGEGKTTTAINLAVALADAGARVLLIDADLRRPMVAERLGFEGNAGLTTVLIGRATFSDVVRRYADTSLHLLAAGQQPPNPSELLGSKAMNDLLTHVGEAYDIVILDSAPVLPVVDSMVLSKLVGGTLLVTSAEGGSKPKVRSALESLDRVEAHVYGVVLTNGDPKDLDNYYGAYGYGYGRKDAELTRRGRRARAQFEPAPAVAPYTPSHARRRG